MTKRFNSPLYSNMVIDMEHKIPSILCVNEEQKKEFLNGLNALHEENQRLLKANMELTEENTNLLSTIRTAYQSERTALGRNVLKQLLDNLE